MNKTTQRVDKRGDNRRNFERVVPERHAPVRVDINGEAFIEVTNAVDISEGGIRISVRHRFAGCDVDQPASVIVYLPAPINRHFSVMGRIKHVLGDSFGVQFATLSAADRALLRRYVKLRSDRPTLVGDFFGYCRSLFGIAR